MPDPPGDVDSSESFNAQLKALLREAHAAGVDVPGGWTCRNGAEHPDWDVVITEVTKPESD
ncbi:Uncharacterized protein HSRCO_2230 [Halanaeroarchaeum sp. HSR-CO]|uniref:hypothetical protein n=1 Tax=Halanaeroarchaeum sp. HSR-CO TaxID=2866382 RepID=UPI00217EC888|nr:hypothetical protein [Halanaeroarchaeum sp. HSR-CO]UWG48499.1 Uncharacterized protein HSRCO_2230 [Halanaeroarchaeum sp. HSR-CO]